LGRFALKQDHGYDKSLSRHTRDASFIELILQTGIRLSEAARLTLDDIELPTWINCDPDNAGNVSTGWEHYGSWACGVVYASFSSA
jgi:integrase